MEGWKFPGPPAFQPPFLTGGTMVVTQEFHLATKGYCDIQNITEAVAGCVRTSGLSNGLVTVFTPSATSAITTLRRKRYWLILPTFSSGSHRRGVYYQLNRQTIRQYLAVILAFFYCLAQIG
jgi:hypothetical protein